MSSPAAPGFDTCPHCSSRGCIPLWRKLTLGPSGSAHCRVCGCKVALAAGPTLLALTPIVAMVVLAVLSVVVNPILLVVPTALCPLATVALLVWWVPLRADELVLPSTVEDGRARMAERSRTTARNTKGGHGA